jgi:hypothetical protein
MPMVVQPLRELQTLPILFFAQTAKSLWSIFRSTVVRPLVYRGRHSAICQWIRGRVIGKSAGSGEPVFTSIDPLLYGP